MEPPQFLTPLPPWRRSPRDNDARARHAGRARGRARVGWRCAHQTSSLRDCSHATGAKPQPPLTELHIIALSGFLITFGALVLLNALRRASFRADAACRLSLASALPKRLVRALPLVLTSCGFVEVLLLAGWAVTAVRWDPWRRFHRFPLGNVR